jgi:phosphate starvation-inducible protein PhoH
MPSNVSKEVTGISLSFKGSKLTVRFQSETKQVTRDELAKLAKEYAQDELELLAQFRKRKIEVIYASDDPRSELESSIKAQKNVRAKRSSRRKTVSPDQLLQPISDPRLHEEGSISTFAEVEE